MAETRSTVAATASSELPEHSNGGYLWNIDQLKESGFAIVRDEREALDHAGIGSSTVRCVTGDLDQADRGQVLLAERRPWQPNAPIKELKLEYDFTGPEESGLSRAEKRQMLGAL